MPIDDGNRVALVARGHKKEGLSASDGAFMSLCVDDKVCGFSHRWTNIYLLYKKNMLTQRETTSPLIVDGSDVTYFRSPCFNTCRRVLHRSCDRRRKCLKVEAKLLRLHAWLQLHPNCKHAFDERVSAIED